MANKKATKLYQYIWKLPNKGGMLLSNYNTNDKHNPKTHVHSMQSTRNSQKHVRYFWLFNCSIQIVSESTA